MNHLTSCRAKARAKKTKNNPSKAVGPVFPVTPAPLAIQEGNTMNNSLEKQLSILLRQHNLSSLDLGVMLVGDNIHFTSCAQGVDGNGARHCSFGNDPKTPRTLTQAVTNSITALNKKRAYPVMVALSPLLDIE